MTVVFLNGSFGVGKTSVAKALAKLLPRSVRYNPEIAGGAILRLPDILKLANQNSGDYQDMPLWRNTTVRGIRVMRAMAPVVIVPMAFSNHAYLSEIVTKVRRFDAGVQHFCLVAPLEIVEARLRQRGDAPKHMAWQLRRARDCCEAHTSPAFAIRIDAVGRGAGEIAREIARIVQMPKVLA